MIGIVIGCLLLLFMALCFLLLLCHAADCKNCCGMYSHAELREVLDTLPETAMIYKKKKKR